jgi:hypothetical protein
MSSSAFEAMTRIDLTPMVAAAEKMRKRLSLQVDESLREWTLRLKAVGTLIERFSLLMLELGWPPDLSIDIRTMRRIMDMYDAHGAEAIRDSVEEYMLRRYDRQRLESLLTDWDEQKWLTKRMPILREVVEAHVSGKYWLSVPALFPQIEGIIAERYGHTGYINPRKLKRYVSECLQSDSGSSISSSLDARAQAFLEQVVLATFQEWLDPPPSTLSRHSILHGHDTGYGTAANSLRAILLFHYLQGRLRRLVSVGRGQCYHLVGCAKVDVRRVDLQSYDDSILAETAGKRPCKLCNPDKL